MEYRPDFKLLQFMWNVENKTHLHLFRPELRTFVIADSSKDAAGAICSQKDAEKEPPKVVDFFSWKWRNTDHKIPLASCYLELAGLVAAADLWRRSNLDAYEPITFLRVSDSVAKLCPIYAKNLCQSDNAVINKFLFWLAFPWISFTPNGLVLKSRLLILLTGARASEMRCTRM